MKTLTFCVVAAMALYLNVSYAAEDYVAEVLVVMDQKALNLHINEILGTDSYANKRAQAMTRAQADIQYTFNETNKILATLAEFDVRIQVKIRAVLILSTNVFPDSAIQNGSIIYDLRALSLYSSWLTQQEAYTRYKYDAAVLLTGFDVSGSSGLSTAGVANIGSICDPTNGISVVEYNGTYITTVINAHNFGILLGTTTAGAASDHIMAFAHYPKDKNRWSFDQCNAYDIKEFLPTLSSNCLLVTDSASKKPESSYATYNGRILDHNAICERKLNDSRSYTCLTSTLYNDTIPKGDTICQQLYCKIPDTSYCLPAFSSDGLICDNRKRCNRGKCVADTSAASAIVDSESVLGDQKQLNFTNYPFIGTCPQFIAQEGKLMCYNSIVVNLCSTTCKKYRTTSLDCEYGDKSYQCPSLEKSNACSENNKAICCFTCRDYVGKRSAREDRRGYRIKDDSHKDAHVLEGFKAKSNDFSKLRAA